MKVKSGKIEIECREARTVSQKFWGLMFRKAEPLLFDFRKDRKYGCSMHTFFVPEPISFIFINSGKKITEIKSAKPFTPIITPKEPSRYVLELPLGAEKNFHVGEKLEFTRASP